jgi:two-component system, OmpR family, sensor kinase
MHQTLNDRWNRISLRTKITGVTVLLLTLGLLVSGVGTMAMLRPYVADLADDKLKTIAQGDLSAYLTDDSAEEKGGTVVSDLRLNSTDDVFIALFNPEGEFVAHNWARRDPHDWPIIPESLTLAEVNVANIDGLHFEDLDDGNGNAEFRAVAVPIVWDDYGSFAPAIIAVSTAETQRLLTAYLTIFLGFGLGVVVVGALLTRMLVTSTFAPLRGVERTAAAIADGDFSQRLGGATPNTEVGRLNRSLNTMLNRIDRAFRDRARTIDQMRRFVGDASHELRTPLVSVRGYAELYRMGALQTPEEIGQAMERIEKEAIRMGGLVEDLLELARLDDPKPLALAPVDLVPLARDAALDATAISPARTVQVITVPLAGPAADETDAPADTVRDGSSDAQADGTSEDHRSSAQSGPIAFAGATLARLRARRPRRTDTQSIPTVPPASDDAGPDPMPTAPMQAVVLAEENKLRQVITNLMANAMRFTPDDSPLEIRVSVDRTTEQATLEVIDHGEGIPPQIREKIFQRFWRADTSRTRETGGSGLGLAIVSSIVATHNGSVDVVETPGGGSTFRVRLPLATSSAAPQSLTG